MRIKEIATCLKISMPNVKVRLHRAKKMLKEKFWKVTSKKDIFEFGDCRCDNITENVMKKIM
jgi:RNA polymerase sigma-70 factor (ECF subfamily)